MYKLYSYFPINNFSFPLISETSKYIENFNKQTMEIYRLMTYNKNTNTGLEQSMPWWFDKDTGNCICSGFIINPLSNDNSLCNVSLSLVFQSSVGGIVNISDILPAEIPKKTGTRNAIIKSYFHIKNSDRNYIGIDDIRDWNINILSSAKQRTSENYFQNMITTYTDYLNQELM